MKKQSYSNQFPIKEKFNNEPMLIKERADFIFKNIEDKMPKLFKYIINSKNKNHEKNA